LKLYTQIYRKLHKNLTVPGCQFDCGNFAQRNSQKKRWHSVYLRKTHLVNSRHRSTERMHRRHRL